MSALDRLRCLPAQIQEVVAHGVRHWAAGVLTTTHLRLSHKTDLREIAPGFSTANEIPDDLDIRQLIAEFSDYAEAIAVVVDVEQVHQGRPL
jgi:hypothetical protein